MVLLVNTDAQKQRPRSARTRRLGGFAASALAVLVGFSVGCAAGSGVSEVVTPGVGRVELGVTNCDSFAGVFEARGRRHPELGLDEPVPGKPPGTDGWRNVALLSEVLDCAPDCLLGLDARNSAFALRFENGALRWAVLHEPTGAVVFHGRIAAGCEGGILSRKEDLDVPLVGHPPFARGDSTDADVLAIDAQGRLIRNRVHGFRGTLFVLVPVALRWTDAWRDFAPAASDVGPGPLFERLPETAFGETVRIAEVPPERAPAPDQPVVQRLLLSDYGDALPRERDAMSLHWALVTAGRESLPGGYYGSRVEVTVRGPRGRRTLRLARSHAPGQEPDFQPVFDVEVALDMAYPAAGRPRWTRPAQALLLVRRAAERPGAH